MLNLNEKYRPRSLNDVVGQARAVAQLRAHLASGSSQSVLFVGPRGSGKTTLARIACASAICEEPDPPCGHCSTCAPIFSGVTFVFGYYALDAAKHGEPEHMVALVQLLESGHPYRFTCFIDEIHRLLGGASDRILKGVGEPGVNCFFYGATTDLLALRPSLRSRCKIIHLAPLSGSETFELLAKVCSAEGIRYEPSALDMIAAGSEGDARGALVSLGQIAAQGDVTADLVADILAFGSADQVIEYFDALLSSDESEQDRVLYEWTDQPSAKARLIRDFLLFLYNFEVAVPRLSAIVNPAFFGVSADDRARIVSGFRSRAGNRRLSDYWLDLLTAWEIDPDQVSDAVLLSIKCRRFHRLVNGEPPEPQRQAPTPTQRRTPGRGRSTRRLSYSKGLTADRPPADRLSLAQAEKIYSAASFLPQNYGILFNCRIALKAARLGASTESEAAQLTSEVLHDLSIRCSTWAAGARCHWLYVHETCLQGTVTEIVAHVPPDALSKVEPWLTKRLGIPAVISEQAEAAIVLDIQRPESARGWQSRRIARHWFLVRRLWRGIDPNILHWQGDLRKPLVDLLKVPKSWRASIGESGLPRRLSQSGSLSPGARAKAQADRMTLLSPFEDAAWDWLDRGWEIDEFEERRIEHEQRADGIRRIEIEWPEGSTQLENARRLEAVNRLRESWPKDGRERRRSWQGWWQEA